MPKFPKKPSTSNQSYQIDASNSPDLFSDVDKGRSENAYAEQSQPSSGKKRDSREAKPDTVPNGSGLSQATSASEYNNYSSSNSDDPTEDGSNSASNAQGEPSSRKIEPDTVSTQQSTSLPNQEESLLSVEIVAERLNCSKSTVWRRQKKDPEFPKPAKFGGLTRWLQSEIRQYIELLKSKRTESQSPPSKED